MLALRGRAEPTRFKAGVAAALFGLLTLGLARGDTVPRSTAAGVLPGLVPVAVAGPAASAAHADGTAVAAPQLLEVVTLQWTRPGVGELGVGPVVVEARLERRSNGVRLTARIPSSDSPQSPTLYEKELMAVAAAMAELLSGAQATAREGADVPPE